jgi:hypothetical protein
MEIKNSGERRITLKDIGWKEVRLQGRHSERSISGWWLPPGVALASGSFFHLHLNHSKGLTNARLEVLINGNSVGNIPLTPENASSTVVKVPLPPNLPGRDPMIVTLRASLDVGAEGARGEEEAWVTVSGDSTLETITEPIRINGLHQAHQFLVRDTFLRKAAFVVPENVSLEEIQLLFDLSMYLGKQLPSSAALWPEACGYSPDTVPPAARLQGRSVFLLGSVPQWKDGLPPGTRLAIGPPDGDADMIRIQRRTYKFSSFEPSLTLMQMLPSPWSAEETLVAGGGWKHFAAPTVKQMITEAAPSGKVYGNLCAMDAAGRTAAYDTRRPSVESFAERIQRRMPLGVGAEETARRAAEEESRIGRSGLWNEVVFYVGGALLLLLVGVRVLLAWDRERSRRRTMRGEKPLGSAP